MRREAASPSRLAALIALGAFAIHQLHYLLVSGSGVGEELRSEGYSYLGHVPLTLAVFAATVIAARLLIARFGRGETRTGPSSVSLRHAALFTVAIFGVYVAQEMLEAALFAHHAGSFLAALAQGWWLAVLLSACFGPILFALDRWLGRLEELVAETAPTRPVSAKGASKHETPPPLVRSSLSPLAFGLARRPPPLALSTH